VLRVIQACWLIYLVYWVVSARSVKPVQEMAPGGTRVWFVLRLLLVAALLGVGARRDLHIYPLTLSLLPRGAVTGAVGVGLTAPGLVIVIRARKTLGQNWSGAASVIFRQGHELITTGPYAYARHPIYTGILLMVLGTAASIGTVGAGLAVLVVLFWFLYRVGVEERLLTKHFPEEYPSYARRVKALVPFIW
jgi:protein-S-isoprenylcysteine O-methyltransferase Ste14